MTVSIMCTVGTEQLLCQVPNRAYFPGVCVCLCYGALKASVCMCCSCIVVCCATSYLDVGGLVVGAP